MRADARANRSAILAAARHLYATRGGVVPLSAIAAEAGVGIATLYRHFPTQHDLVVGLMTDVRDRVAAICESALATMATDPEAGWLEYARTVGALEIGEWVPNVADAEPGDTLADDLLALRADGLVAVARVVAEAQRHGLVRSDLDALHVQFGLSLLTRPLPPVLLREMPGLKDWLLKTYLRGIAPG